MGFFDGLERVKQRIHSTKIPLSRRGQAVMTLVYFSLPVIGGYYIMQWAIGKEEKNRHNWQQGLHVPTPAITIKDLNQGLHPPKKD